MTQPSGIFLSRRAYTSILPRWVIEVAQSMTNGNASSVGHPNAMGFVPRSGSTPNVGATLGPPLFAASMAAIGPHGLLVPALALCAGGAAIALWAERRAALVRRATTTGRIG